MTPKDLKLKRITSGIAGSLVCRTAGIPRSRLSDIEREYVTPDPDELLRISQAIEQISSGRGRIEKLAKEAGLSLAAVGL
jgi:hypothetical protein